MSKCNSLFQDKQEKELETLTSYFTKLDNLRDTGSMNMWGAGDYLKNHYGISEVVSRATHAVWMDTFDGKSTAEERAIEALSTRDTLPLDKNNS